MFILNHHFSIALYFVLRILFFSNKKLIFWNAIPKQLNAYSRWERLSVRAHSQIPRNLNRTRWILMNGPLFFCIRYRTTHSMSIYSTSVIIPHAYYSRALRSSCVLFHSLLPFPVHSILFLSHTDHDYYWNYFLCKFSCRSDSLICDFFVPISMYIFNVLCAVSEWGKNGNE